MCGLGEGVLMSVFVPFMRALEHHPEHPEQNSVSNFTCLNHSPESSGSHFTLCIIIRVNISFTAS